MSGERILSGKAGVVVRIVGTLLVLLAFVGPWWTWTISVPALSIRTNADLGLFGGTLTVSWRGVSTTTTLGYMDLPNTGGVLQIGALLAGIGMAFGVVSSALTMIRIRPGLSKVGTPVSVFAFVFVLLAAVYVMMSLPSAYTQDTRAGGLWNPGALPIPGFWGTQSLGYNIPMSYGAGWGWYMLLIGGIVLLVGAILRLRSSRTAMVSPLTSPSSNAPTRPLDPPRSPP